MQHFRGSYEQWRKSRKRKGTIHALLLVSLCILLTDACFVWINYRSDWNALRLEQQHRAEHVHKAFTMALRTMAINMQQARA